MDITLKFVWIAESSYENEKENLSAEVETYHTDATWKGACDEAAELYFKDGEEVMNFDAESELIEISHDLKAIYQAEIPEKEFEAHGRLACNYHEDWEEVSAEVYEYYAAEEQKAMMG